MTKNSFVAEVAFNGKLHFLCSSIILRLTNLKSEKKSYQHKRLLFCQAVVSVMAVIFYVNLKNFVQMIVWF